MASALSEAPLQLDLGPSVASAGFAVRDHEAVIAALASFQLEGVPERAVAKRRAEFLAGRWAARTALLALGVEAIPLRNEDGSPRWPVDIIGSITHGAERAQCAVARTSELRSLGIDAERLMAESASTELRARICDPAERALLAASIPAPEHHLITFAFSAKESLYKCLYPLVGRFMDFGAARVQAAHARVDGALLVGELTLALSVDWSEELPRGRTLQARFCASERHVESAVLLLA